MYVVSNSISDGWNKSAYLPSRVPSPQILLFVAPIGSIPNCLKYASKREFPGIVAEQVPNLAAACTAFEHPVRLLLIDTAFAVEIEAYAPKLSQQHPDAMIALAHDNGSCSIRDVLPLKAIKGILQMNLKLDIWLSVIRLLLNGGEYFPPKMLQSYFERTAANVNDDRTDSTKAAETHDPGIGEIGNLTERESQILELVARGLQNKVIAAALNLSEHTVKIHIHNIIRKLGAHNRTEAAVAFHKRHLMPSCFAAIPSTA
jgi:DNA-binding NarL/FixJ family response regulator